MAPFSSGRLLGPLQSIMKNQASFEIFPCFRKPSLSCVIVLSTGQPYHEGKKFKETIDYARKHFNEVTLVKADSLQRYNCEKNETIEECKERYVKKGHAWEKRHASAIHSLGDKPFHLMNWDDFLNMPLYEEALNVVMALYREDVVFKKVIETSVSEYVTRKKREYNGSTILEKEWANASRDYILEESAVLLLWNFSHILYPRKPNPALCYLLDQIHYINPNVLKIVPPRQLKKVFGKRINQLNSLLYEENLSESEQLQVLHELQFSCLNLARSLKCISERPEMLLNAEKFTEELGEIAFKALKL